MAIDLKKNKEALDKALKQIVDTNDETNWVIFGYEGQTTILKVVETGDGGIEEMADDLSAGKMLYAYCSIKDPNTDLNKYVLIHWTGESVPENIKLKYTAHLRDVKDFLKGVHVTIVARTEMDIDEEDITKKVAKASGANYSVHKEKAVKEDSPTPVGSDYKRVRPDREINLNARDKFWSQAEKDETSRQKNDKERADEERKHLDSQRKERELEEAKERERQVAERMKGISEQKNAEKRANRTDEEGVKQRWAQVQKESSIDEEERGHRSDQMRRERMEEASKLATSSTSKNRDFFKQKSTERPTMPDRGHPPVRKLRNEFGSSSDTVETSTRKEPIQLPTAESNPSPPKPVFQQSRPLPSEPQQSEPQSPVQQAEPTATQEPPSPTHSPSESPSQPQTRDLLRQGLPPRQESDPEDDQDWDEDAEEDKSPQQEETRVPHTQPEQSPPTHFDQPSKVSQETADPSQDHAQEEEVYVMDSPPANDNVNGNSNQNNHADSQEAAEGAADQGLCARTLYDYQAADDTEITFDPDQMITNIEQIDEGWWQGFGPDGSYGMFPSNYVELVN